jgi:hypothetical protein
MFSTFPAITKRTAQGACLCAIALLSACGGGDTADTAAPTLAAPLATGTTTLAVAMQVVRKVI